ncbi:MAG: class IV adenylate cyclase [Phycisphaerae bacterium]|nr:class IV adenylate cyclase [Phycisphaerae bacterium]
MGSMNEIEAKYSVESFAAVRKALRGAGAVFLGTVRQWDEFYDRPDMGFRKKGCGLRLRRIKILRRGDEPINAQPIITFKGPRQAAEKVKIRREIETALASADAAAELLVACGLRAVMTVRKRRSSFRLGRARIELDELPLLGKFIEIEGLSERHVETVRRRLGIKAQCIKISYAHMLAEKCKELGLDAVGGTGL